MYMMPGGECAWSRARRLGVHGARRRVCMPVGAKGPIRYARRRVWMVTGPKGSENVMPGGMSECSHWPVACECAEPGGGAHG